jgi:hypothetical protein
VWQTQFASPNLASTAAVLAAPSGDAFVTGLFAETMDLGKSVLTSAGSADIFVARYNAAGRIVWARRFGGADYDAPRTLDFDREGNLLITGTFRGTVDFGTGPLVGAGLWDIFLVRIRRDGTVLTSRCLGGPGSDYARDVAVDSRGNTYLIGQSNDVVDFGGGPLVPAGGHDITLVKLDADDHHVWSRMWGDALTDYGHGVALGAGDEPILAGAFRGTVDFGGGPFTADQTNTDAYLVRLDADGSHRWSRRFGGAGRQELTRIVTDSGGDAIVAGTFYGTTDWGGGPLTSVGQQDIVLARYDGNGDHSWSGRYGSVSLESPLGLALRGGNPVMAASSFGNLDLGAGPLPNRGAQDAFLAEWTPGGAPEWSVSFGGPGHDRPLALAAASNGDLLAAGEFWYTASFGGEPLTSLGISDGFAIRLGEHSEAGAPQSSPVRRGPSGGDALLTAYPNPARSRVAISYVVPRSGRVSLVTYDVAGRRRSALVDRPQGPGAYSVEWEPSPGVYWLTLTVDGGSVTRRVVSLR